MEIFIMILLIVVGMGLLVFGADMFVDGASGIAKKLRVSAFVIGMTIVAFGTSAPELAVSIKSALSGSGDIAMGNAVGSNIMNILLILGLSAIIRPLPVEKKTVFIEVPFLVAISGILLLLSTVGGREISHIDGLILVLLFGVYISYMVVGALRERKTQALPAGGLADNRAGQAPAANTEENESKSGLFGFYGRMQDKTWFLIVITIIGLAFAVLGAQLVVDNVNMLTAMIPNENAKKIMSVTVVALGTSLPELVTSVTAAVKGNTGLALGNIIGSNIMNILLILGLPALLFGIAYQASFLVDILVSLGAAALLLGCVAIGRGKGINRAGGILMLACLSGYLVYLFLS